MAKLWVVLWMLLAVAIFGFTYCITKQRQAFWKRWKEEGMRDIALNFTDPSEPEELKPIRRKSFFRTGRLLNCRHLVPAKIRSGMRMGHIAVSGVGLCLTPCQ